MVGVGWAVLQNSYYGMVVFAGLFFDVVVYTIWLKRRTSWSIVWGGISGGMPILAGRVLAIGQVDFIGLLLLMAVLFWIPTHILTFSMRYYDDYLAAKVPTFCSAYGFEVDASHHRLIRDYCGSFHRCGRCDDRCASRLPALDGCAIIWTAAAFPGNRVSPFRESEFQLIQVRVRVHAGFHDFISIMKILP